MARPKDADSAATYDGILEAATHILETEGVAALSLRRVAENSGQSLGAINYYFENRNGLLEACLQRSYEWLSQLVRESLGRIVAGVPWKEEVDRFVRTLFRETRKHRTFVRTRLLTTMQAGELPEQRMRGELLPALDKISAVLGGSKAAVKLRLAAHSLELIVTRYALHTDEECLAIACVDNLEEALKHIEDHLVALCVNAFEEALS